jgi:hypothetical protein
MRVSHAEREQAVVLLKAAFVQGRLAKDEFELRVGWALASRTRAELAAVTADIPADLMGAQLPWPARERGGKKVAAPVLGAFAAWLSIVVAASFWAGESGPAQQSLGVAIVVILLYVSIVSFCVIASWLERRASRRTARGLLHGAGRASRCPVDGQRPVDIPFWAGSRSAPSTRRRGRTGRVHGSWHSIRMPAADLHV